ncbi:PP-loop family-domain-containing protein [Lophiotrema nucula]|uniref:tRNA(Ile)-lysidine synthetase n=1 Tax=Lophiotrema nucula TaxID=690887 RepID=A0A6A5ZPA3_9PLEO|nr:PP-loop family-domain-containing protein [Lophiotrema nucula]
MALATLYTKAARSSLVPPNCHAFIIDHKARPESAEEARWVAEQLRSKFDMESTIIPLVWPKDLDPNDTTKFETAARKLRYRALGLACGRQNVRMLMTAHHGDDVAETILMRLILKRWRSGLQGMFPVQWIPECHGVHGVHHSGGLKKAELQEQSKIALPFPIEQGGIQLLRPLLAFEKSRLIATCEDNGTPWVEDKTNHDRTLTARNACRHIMKHHRLPSALSQPSLVTIAHNMQARVGDVKAKAEKLFDNCPLELNIQTGSLIVRLPRVDSLLNRPITTESDRNEARNIAYSLLARLTDLVSPQESTIVTRFARIVGFIYPSLSSTGTEDAHNQSIPYFNLNSVWFRPLLHGKPLDRTKSPQYHEGDWLFSRQPFQFLEHSAVSITIPPLSSSEGSRDPQWHLFDGRFWIRIHNHTPSPLILRPFKHADLETLAAETKANPDKTAYHSRVIKAAIARIKPADLRLGLPVIAQVNPDGEDNILTLPTLYPSGSILPDIHWELRYKKVDMGSRALHEVVAVGIREPSRTELGSDEDEDGGEQTVDQVAGGAGR